MILECDVFKRLSCPVFLLQPGLQRNCNGICRVQNVQSIGENTLTDYFHSIFKIS